MTSRLLSRGPVNGFSLALTRALRSAKMREQGVRGLLVYCSDYHRSHSTAISADPWPDDLRLSDLEPPFVCKACGKRGADVRPVKELCQSRTCAIGGLRVS